MKVLSATIAAGLLVSVTANAADFDVRSHADNGDRYAAAAERIAAKITEGRNDRVTPSQRLVSAIKKSARAKGACISTKVNPGQDRASFNQQIRKAYRGVNPKTTVASTKISSRFTHKGLLIRVCVLLDGNGHHAAVQMTNTKENWDKAAEELRKRLEALKNNA